MVQREKPRPQSQELKKTIDQRTIPKSRNGLSLRSGVFLDVGVRGTDNNICPDFRIALEQ